MTHQPTRALPMFIGQPERQLFGMLHPPAESKESCAAVLLCPPFGQEAIQSQRTFRVLAERLARAGHPALRFDYFQQGDSDGEGSEISLRGLCRDIPTADKSLRDFSGQRPVIWLGLGLGATAAWLAAVQSTEPPDYLLLWEPVLDGDEYRNELTRRHEVLLGMALSVRSGKVRPAMGGSEAIGYLIPTAFGAELAALCVGTLPELPPGVRPVVISEPANASAEALAARMRAADQNSRHIELQKEIEWMDERFGQGALVPAKALQLLLKLVRECS